MIEKVDLKGHITVNLKVWLGIKYNGPKETYIERNDARIVNFSPTHDFGTQTQTQTQFIIVNYWLRLRLRLRLNFI